MATQPLPSDQPTSIDYQRVEAFTHRVVNDIGTALRGALCYIGDKLGIFKAMAGAGPLTVEQLAEKTGLDQRYLREWLGAMATGEYVEFNPWKKTYYLPPEHALPLAHEDFPYFAGGFMEMIVPAISVAPKVAEAFRTGRGVPQSDYSPEMFEAIERGTAPWYRNELVQNWLPLMPQVQQALSQGGAYLDVGCGGGRAAITVAQAFPKAKVFGFDNHLGSVERARQNAEAAGIADRATFDVADAKQLPVGMFDFITTFDVIHDAVDPVGIMSAIRQALKPEGTFLMVEMNCSPDVHDNINPIGRFLYSISTLYCMTTSLAHEGAGIGAVMGEPKARELAQQAGFRHFRKLDVQHPFSVLYELRP